MHQLKVVFSVLCLVGVTVCMTRSSEKNFESANIVDQCNQTFPIKPEFLKDLNTTGSFSDESDKGPMCFMHCFLTKIGVMGEEGQINNDKAVDLYELDDEEMAIDCNNEMVAASISDPCGKAYFFVRCLMTRAMINSKDAGDEHVK